MSLSTREEFAELINTAVEGYLRRLDITTAYCAALTRIEELEKANADHAAKLMGSHYETARAEQRATAATQEVVRLTLNQDYLEQAWAYALGAIGKATLAVQSIERAKGAAIAAEADGDD